MILAGNLAYIHALRGETWYSRAYHGMISGLRHFNGMEDAEGVHEPNEAA